MSELERLLLELELKGLKELLDFHRKKAENEGMTTEQQAHIDAILDLIFEVMKQLNENEE
jgi:ribosome assembly protein YihI (activator of Der GTPase)